MSKNGFSNYKLIAHEKNVGTVHNFIDGLEETSGRFIKLISPGDALIGDNTLSAWVEKMVASGKGWSFCRVINYRRNKDGTTTVVSARSNPQDFRPYIKEDYETCRWNYVALNDLATGASMICAKELLVEYLEFIKGKVVYAEDNVYRIMAFDGEVAYYNPINGVRYELGDGVSTSSDSKWHALVHKDWVSTDNTMIDNMAINDCLQGKMKKVLQRQYSGNKYYRRLRFYLDKGRFVRLLKWKFCPKMTQIIEE